MRRRLRGLLGGAPSPPPAAGDHPGEPATRLKGSQARLLARMRADNANADLPFAPTSYWTDVNRRFDEWLTGEGIKNVAQQAYNRYFSTPERRSPKWSEFATWMLYRAVRDKDAHGLLDRVSAEFAPKAAHRYGDHVVSWDVLISLDRIYALIELDARVLDQPVVVADIGAGWGRLGYVLKRVNPAATYVALDLPESLLVAGTYLPKLLPDVPVVGYEAHAAAERIQRAELLAEPALRFAGTHHLPRFEPGAFDVLANVASFQEMTHAQVTAYLGWADRTARRVYLQERWTRPSSLPEDIVAGWEAYAIPERWRRRFLRDVPFSPLFFEAGFDVAPEA